MKTIKIAIIFSFLFNFSAKAQEDLKPIIFASKEQLKIFQNILEKLTTEELTDAEKRKLIFNAQKLFAPNAMIQTMDLNKTRRSYPVKEYLERVTFPLDPRVDINIYFLKEPEITKIEKINFNKELKTSDEYLVYGRLVQYYEKLVNGIRKYSDYTVKSARVKVSKKYDFGTGEIYTEVLILEINAEEIYQK